MRLQFLGSAASEGIPALWCECDNCKKALQLGGKDLRRRTSYLIGDHTLVDIGPDIDWQVREFGIDLARIRRILVTHSHVDHFNPTALLWRGRNFSVTGYPIRLFCNWTVLNLLERHIVDNGFGTSVADLKLEPTVLESGVSVTDGGLEILPIRATHAKPEEQALNYLLTENGRSVLIANDTGWWADESWDLVRGRKLESVVIEMSMGIREPYAHERKHHLGAQAAIEFIDRLSELGAVDASTMIATTHISHHVGATQAELEEYFQPYGIRVGFDGMVMGEEL